MAAGRDRNVNVRVERMKKRSVGELLGDRVSSLNVYANNWNFAVPRFRRNHAQAIEVNTT